MNRPEQRNALSAEMWKRLAELVSSCSKDPEVDVLVFRSAIPESFCAGADLSDLETIAKQPERAAAFCRLPLLAEKEILHSPKPTIAMINGYCIGGGVQLAAACDFRFCTPKSVFAVTAAKLGIVYFPSSTKRLLQLIGPAQAKDLLLTGRTIGAPEAKRMGLVHDIFPDGQLEEKTFAFARQIQRNSPRSVRDMKGMIERLLVGEPADSPEFEAWVKRSLTSEDLQEGLSAFFEKRRPRFRREN